MSSQDSNEAKERRKKRSEAQVQACKAAEEEERGPAYGVELWMYVPAVFTLAFLPPSSPDFHGHLHTLSPSPLTSRNSSAICPDGWHLATSSSADFRLERSRYCIRVERKKKTWDKAVKQCRQGTGFLIRLEKLLMVDEQLLFDHLREKGLERLWTGVHVDHDTLVWDALRPSMVRSYLGPSEQFGWSKRGWTFDKDSLAEEDQKCGSLRLMEGQGSDSQSQEVTLSGRARSVMGSRPQRLKRSSLDALPSMPSPVVKTPAAEAEDSPSPTKGVPEDKRFENLHQFLANEGFREKFLESVIGDPNASNAFLNFLLGKTTTTATTTTTTDQSNLEDDDFHFVTKRSTKGQKPRVTTTSVFVKPITTDTTTSTTNVTFPNEGIAQMLSSASTQFPTLTPERSVKGTSLPASTASQTTSVQTDPSSMDAFLKFLFETTFNVSNGNDVNKSLGNNNSTESGNPRRENSRTSGVTVSGSGFGKIDANAYLRQLIKKATATVPPTSSASDGAAIDILSRLLTSAMDYGRHGDSISERTSTSVPRNEAQMKSSFPNVLNPANFVQLPPNEKNDVTTSHSLTDSNVQIPRDMFVETTTSLFQTPTTFSMKMQQKQGGVLGKKYLSKVRNSFQNGSTPMRYFQDLVDRVRNGFTTTTTTTTTTASPLLFSTTAPSSFHTSTQLMLRILDKPQKLNDISENGPFNGVIFDELKMPFQDPKPSGPTIHKTTPSLTEQISPTRFHSNAFPTNQEILDAKGTQSPNVAITMAPWNVPQNTIPSINKSTTDSQEDSMEVDAFSTTIPTTSHTTEPSQLKSKETDINTFPDYSLDKSSEVQEESSTLTPTPATASTPIGQFNFIDSLAPETNSSTGSEDKDSLVLQGFSKGHDSSNAANEVTTDIEFMRDGNHPGNLNTLSKQNKHDTSWELLGSNVDGGSSQERDRIPGIDNDFLEPEEKMVMSDCEDERSFVCMTEAIEVLTLVGQCDRNWLGHRLLDRCYRPFPSMLSEREARRKCHRFGASLAMADTDFYGNVTQLLLQQRPGYTPDMKAWVDTSLNLDIPVTSGCSAVADGQLVSVDCNERLPLICQMDIRFKVLPHDNGEIDESQATFIYNRTSKEVQTLWCPLRMSSFDDVILWYKDGRPIVDTDDHRYRNGDMPTHLNIDLSILERTGEGGGRLLKPAMLQGVYWCEMWRSDPFRRVTSPKIFLKFTDIISIHGWITTEPFSEITGVLFNQMGHVRGRPQIMERNLARMNKNITRVLQRRIPVVREVITFIKSIRASEGRTEFFTYIGLARGHVSSHMTGQLAQAYINLLREAFAMAENTLRERWRMHLPVQESLTISMPDMCPEVELFDSKTGLRAKFPVTRVNSGALSVDVCDGVYSGTAWCRGDLQSGAYWDEWQITASCQDVDEVVTSSESKSVDGDDVENSPNSDDVSEDKDRRKHQKPSVAALIELEEVEIESANVDDVTEWLAEALVEADADDFNDADIEVVANVIDKVMRFNRPDSKISDELIQTVDRVLDAPLEELKRAEMESHAPSRLLEDLEVFGDRVDIGTEANLRMVAPNLAMEVWDMADSQDLVIGFGAKRLTSWESPLSDLKITTIKNRQWMNQHLSDFDVAIELPESLVTKSVKFSESSLRLSMFIYRKVGLFLADTEVGDDHSMVNSAIISASLGGQRVKDLEDKVRLVFKPFQDPTTFSSKSRCVFWDTDSRGRAGWSSDGCVYNGTVDGREVCLCDHLTNFAILMDFYGEARPLSPEHDLSLSILTMAGVGLSIFGLVVTIITFLAFKKLRQGRAQQTLFNMAIALLCFQITFLVGFKQTVYWPVCLAVSVLLHYFVMVSFAWMLIEAVLQYLTFVKVLGTYISRYTLKTVVPAWGIPLVPVIALLTTDYKLYLGRQDYCWMNINAFYFAFALPVGIVILFNIVMFVIILASLLTRPKGLRSNQINSRARETNFKAAVTIFILLGLTWLFGYLAVEDARLPFQYTFTILSSLQGFLIFVLMVLRRKQVRDHWHMACCRRHPESKPTQRKKLSHTSSSGTSNNSYSNNTRILPSFFNHAYTTNTNVECSSNSSNSSGGGDVDEGNEYYVIEEVDPHRQ